MKSFRLLLVLFILCGMTSVANAYRINVLDPTIYDIYPSTLSGGTLNITFTACDTAQLHQTSGTDVSNFGCYSAFNETGGSITTLELVFDKTGLFASGFTCGQDYIGVALSFANETCSVGPTQIAIFLSGGTGIPETTDGSYFTIYISGLPDGTTDGLTPGQSIPSIPPPTVSAPAQIVIPAGAVSTPEPGSLALLSTGLASLGAAGWRKRHWTAHNS